MKTILLCSDGSKYGETATRYAAEMAGAFSATVRALHVVDIRLLEGPFLADVAGLIGAEAYMAQLPAFRTLLEEKGSAILGNAEQICAHASIKVEKLLRVGHPVRIILDEGQKTDLVVLGQRGEHADWGGELTGSVMDRVTRRVRKPCLITPADHAPMRRVLVAYDGSEHAQHALTLAAEVTKLVKGSLVLATVVERGRMHDAVEAISRHGVELAQKAGVQVEEALCLEGAAGVAILGAAHEKRCDLLAIGAHGHSRFRELVLGSTTAHLLHHARIPVLLVP